MNRLVYIFLAALWFSSCIELPNTFTKIPPGQWRGVLKLTDPDIISIVSNAEDEKVLDYFELPFNMEVYYDENDILQINLVNGDEKIAVENIHFGRDPKTAKDTIKMEFTAFDTHIDAFYEENLIEGKWHVHYKDNYSIPFIAYYGQNYRFETNNIESAYDYSGQWNVEFNYDSEDSSYPAIAEFKQEGNRVSGTFQTETGDYRFLEGNSYGSKLRMSVFDGAHAFLFRAQLENDTLYGEFRSGKHYKSKWKATRLNNEKLSNPYEMTKATSEDAVKFSFPSTEKKQVSIDDPEYTDKIKLVNIMGTWCPNCRDEIKFLKEIEAEFGTDRLAIFSLAFEKYRDENSAFEIMSKYKNVLGFDWPFLLGGYANKTETAEILTFVDKIYSYPTLLMLNEENEIVDIHTGFYGPATSKYEAFKKEYIAKLKAELD